MAYPQRKKLLRIYKIEKHKTIFSLEIAFCRRNVLIHSNGKTEPIYFTAINFRRLM